MSTSAKRTPSPVSAAARAFGRFWWDFLIGDTPELFVAGLVILGAVAVLAQVSATAAWIVEPVLVLAALVISVLKGRRS